MENDKLALKLSLVFGIIMIATITWVSIANPPTNVSYAEIKKMEDRDVIIVNDYIINITKEFGVNSIDADKMRVKITTHNGWSGGIYWENSKTKYELVPKE